MLINRLKQSFFYGLYRNLRWRFFANGIIGRHACLGDEVFGLLNVQSFENLQKNRIDLILGGRQSVASIPDLPDIVPGSKTRGLIARQKLDFFKFLASAELLVMDSYSELVDQCFESEGTQFYCTYGDIKKERLRDLESFGLLSLDDLSAHYSEFFEKCFYINSDLKIIFMHYPTIKEERALFLNRAKKIKDVIVALERQYEGRLHQYWIDENQAAAANVTDSDPDTYHYCKTLYGVFAEEICKDFPALKR